MSAVAEHLPLSETISPEDQCALAVQVADAYAGGTAMYPIGGGTSLDYGVTPTQPGLGISTARLTRIVDYPARDMTITVEAGITMDTLAATLAVERQWLPIDVPQAAAATLGGVVATAFSGARRYGNGTMRDYVIGVSAVDGRGMPFKAGGRVVKNVAGYDFCKLLTGSLGTLAVISQLTLKIKPLPERSAFLVADVHDLPTAERLLGDLVNSATTPSAIELLAGPRWRETAALGTLTAGSTLRLAVGLEGTTAEVAWMVNRLTDEWHHSGATATRALFDEQSAALWRDLAEFPHAPDAPLVIKASVLPSRVSDYVNLVRQLDPDASVQAHAANGIVVARFATFDAGDISRKLIGRLQPAAALAGGRAVVLSSTIGGLTRQAVWGGVGEDTAWMEKVKAQFDPKALLNPGRFVYASM